MPKCSECRYEGPYSIHTGQRVTFVMKDGMAETTMKYMKCKALGDGPIREPISFREAMNDTPCDFFKSKEKPQPQKGISGFFSNLLGGKKHTRVKFKEKSVQGLNKYEVYTAKTKNEAMEFLRSKSVPERLYYIIVETPEGNWGLDVNGIYQEK